MRSPSLLEVGQQALLWQPDIIFLSGPQNPTSHLLGELAWRAEGESDLFLIQSFTIAHTFGIDLNFVHLNLGETLPTTIKGDLLPYLLRPQIRQTRKSICLIINFHQNLLRGLSPVTLQSFD